MRIDFMLIGLVVLAIGAALVIGVMTQTTTIDKNKVAITNPGVIPFVLPDSVFGFPLVAIGGLIALIGAGITIFGFNAF